MQMISAIREETKGGKGEGGGLIKSKARRGEALVVALVTGARLITGRSGAIFAAQGIVIAVGSFFVSKGLRGDEG